MSVDLLRALEDERRVRRREGAAVPLVGEAHDPLPVGRTHAQRHERRDGLAQDELQTRYVARAQLLEVTQCLGGASEL